MRSLDQIDSWIAGKIKAWSSKVAGAPGGRELLEIRRDILEHVRNHIAPQGDGRNLFPYNSVRVRIGARNDEEQEYLKAAFDSDGTLEQDVRALLQEAGCKAHSTCEVTVSLEEDGAVAPGDRPFQIAYANVAQSGATANRSRTRPAATLRVTRGDADLPEYRIESDRVNIGRLKEVIGDKDGLRRRNDIAFADTETTVSREHASIRYDPESGKFRLFDSGSQRGTNVFRDGRRLQVPKGSGHGLPLRSRDEIHLGDARVVFESEENS